MPIATTLNLAVADYTDARHWYWRLTDEGGGFLADQEVKLSPFDFEYEGFLDLPAYLAVHAAPDRRREDEARLVKQLGEWMGRNFYGPIGEKILDAGTPAIVRVQVPEEAAGLLYRPWELGYVNGQPLALQDVTLIFEVPGEVTRVRRVPVGERLRILAVFSLPVDENALNLRQERYEMARTIRGIGQQGRAIDLRVLQYGVTRESLKGVLEEGDGWDVVHFSGHGLEAHLILEKPDGTTDRVPSNDLIKLLRPARGRLKWVTLSACLSAAATVQETLVWLGKEPKRGPVPTTATGEIQTVARALVQSLDCGVLAMRYRVGDQFAIDLGRGLFEGVLEKGQSLVRALQVTLPRVLDGQDVDANAVAIPTLFGRYAAEVELSAPKGESPVRLGMSYFPPEPERFVGRVGLLTQARVAMARESASAGVLFHGMSGGGKTACALELAYQYRDIDRFQHFVWFKAPKEDDDISGALIGLAKQWDIQGTHPSCPWWRSRMPTTRSSQPTCRVLAASWNSAASWWCWTIWNHCCARTVSGGTSGGRS